MRSKLEYVRLIEFPACRMVTSGIGFFGDENFTRFEKMLEEEDGKYPYPQDFLTGNAHGMEWLCLYRDGMDTLGMNVIDFPGGLYAVVCGIDAQSNAEEMRAVTEFMETHGLVRDDSRPDMGHIIGSLETQAVLGYEQMDYFTPVKLKERYRTMEITT